MKVEIEVDDRMYKLAQEWKAIEQANPLPETESDPKGADPKWMKAFEAHDKLREDFLLTHKLVKKGKTEKFMGFSIPVWVATKNKKEFDKAISILNLLKGGK